MSMRRLAHHYGLVDPAGVGLNDSVAVLMPSGNLAKIACWNDAKTSDDDAIDHATLQSEARKPRVCV